ncbi:hypothetical protein QE152_g4351 [Popillia japonica]|uniref:Pre-rRNA-processing protein TSR2 homolog n=1 Tax=Popillia japonica TaxID=7064 RepID=A0AAW1MVZ0_POPJA
MWKEALGQCTPEIWNNCVLHTEKLIKEWYEREKVLDIAVEEFIISLADDDSTSDEFDLAVEEFIISLADDDSTSDEFDSDIDSDINPVLHAQWSKKPYFSFNHVKL